MINRFFKVYLEFFIKKRGRYQSLTPASIRIMLVRFTMHKSNDTHYSCEENPNQ